MCQIAVMFLPIIFFRIVVCLLESFHFNLTSLTETEIEGKGDREKILQLFLGNSLEVVEQF